MFTFDKTDAIHQEPAKDRLTEMIWRIFEIVAPPGAILLGMVVLYIFGWIVLI